MDTETARNWALPGLLARARITFEQAGTVRVLLPLPAGPGQVPPPAKEFSEIPEVSPSPPA
ncbi:hypothetical protein [Streptomyces xylophagus]|uniref:hypothetical protein n=1 Tax=Streptomyces xylophagus TaxID=285514 RepID=UPI0018FEE041|nr:hypothetical protein [Streptomyces xylophagus]